MDDSIFDRHLDDQLCFRLYRASNGINRLYAHALQSFNLTFPQYIVLLALWDHNGTPITTIGAQTGMGIGTINPILKRLTEAGWLEKKPHPTDGRTMLIYLTAKAYASKSAINQAILREVTAYDFAGLNIPELMNQLGILLERMDESNHQDDRRH